MTKTMRAVVLDAPGPPDALQIREVPRPQPEIGWVFIEVKAFGLNLVVGRTLYPARHRSHILASPQRRSFRRLRSARSCL